MSTSEDGTDAEVLRAVGEGDEAALRVLFDRHAAWITLRLRRRTTNEELVSDALQDTFVAVWRNASRFRGEGDVGAWMWGIAIRQLLQRFRGKRLPVPVGAELISATAQVVQSAEDELLVAVEHGDVGNAMRSLSPELRTVIKATVIDGLTTREAARLLDLPHGTVKSRLRAAKSQLREQLIPIQGWGR
ncbi:MAG TPA: RNA polymerase sigma factor [Nocardioides sp.]|nr:RNA polymerase sigma factor [Nocardioides sp.]